MPMIPKTKLCARNREATLATEAKVKFFNAPMNAVICNCGNKVVAQGRCQTCYDQFLRGVRIERVRMHQQDKEKKAEHRKMWKLFD